MQLEEAAFEEGEDVVGDVVKVWGQSIDWLAVSVVRSFGLFSWLIWLVGSFGLFSLTFILHVFFGYRCFGLFWCWVFFQVSHFPF